jgi:hypothetical protein
MRRTLLALVFLAAPATLASAKTWECVIDEICSGGFRCQAMDPPQARRLVVDEGKAMIFGAGWTSEMRLIGRTDQQETFVEFENGEPTMMTLFHDGILMQSNHVLNHPNSGIYTQYGRCQEVQN